jgi:hypothetical protein
VLDPIAWTTGNPGEGDTIPFSTRLRSDKGAQDTLNEFFRLCDENPDTCAFSGGAADRFAALAASLRLEPIQIVYPDGSSFPFTYQDLISNSLGAMYDSFSWPDFALFLAGIESEASSQKLGKLLYAVWTDLGYINKRGFPHYPNYVEGFPAVACGDSDNPDNYPAWWDAAQQAEADFGYFGPLWTYVSSICAAWPGGQAGRYPGPFTAPTANPVLVVGPRVPLPLPVRRSSRCPLPAGWHTASRRHRLYPGPDSLRGFRSLVRSEYDCLAASGTGTRVGPGSRPP